MNKENTPKYLYKYYPSKNWDFIAKKWTIRFTPVSELNDPFESMPISDNILSTKNKEYLQKNCMISSGFEIFFCEEIIKKYGVISLTETNDNLVMWSHYAENHKGFVVEFDVNKSNFLIRNKGISVHKVEYSESRLKHFEEEEKRTPISFIGSKSISWSYEREWRTIININQIGGEDKKGIYKINKDSISSIIFGANNTVDKVKELCKEISYQENCSHIKFKIANFHPPQYALNIKEIDPSFYK